ncbi:MAG: YqgE/AlgH family protein [Desulfococcaceae bacterium]|jgi:putative transcriptional regulator|nr:YqgE/AlgH family protein [Desulfococcaceae bacterium]
MESSLSLKGHFLIAMPGMEDPNFSDTVLCICEHTPNGSVGVVVNRIYPSVSVKDIYQELRIDYIPEAGAVPVHFGGPVHMNEIFILHGPPFGWEACLRITPNLGMSNTRDILEAIAMGRGPESYIIALGCSGWGANQIETEMMQNVWLSCPLSEYIIFDLSLEERWEEALRKMGINPALLSDTAGHA